MNPFLGVLWESPAEHVQAIASASAYILVSCWPSLNFFGRDRLIAIGGISAVPFDNGETSLVDHSSYCHAASTLAVPLSVSTPSIEVSSLSASAVRFPKL